MKNINIEMEDDLYWELVEIKASYKAKKWSNLLKIFVKVVNGLDKKVAKINE